jgi:hypothetical protein
MFRVNLKISVHLKIDFPRRMLLALLLTVT